MDRNMFGIIYCATRIDDGRMYYGQTNRSIDDRKREHNCGAQKGSKYLFHRQLFKHEFIWNVIEECESREKLNEREMFYVLRDRTNERAFGFNLTSGGDTMASSLKGKQVPDHVRKKISEAHKGKVFSEKTRQKIAESLFGRETWMKGKTHSLKSKQKLSETQKNRLKNPVERLKQENGMRGKHHSEETRRKMSKSQRQRPGKKVIQLDNENVVATYSSIHQASREAGIAFQNISHACHGRYKRAGGFQWRFKDE